MFGAWSRVSSGMAFSCPTGWAAGYRGTRARPPLEGHQSTPARNESVAFGRLPALSSGHGVPPTSGGAATGAGLTYYRSPFVLGASGPEVLTR